MVSLHVLAQLQANDPTGVIIKQRFNPNKPVHVAGKQKCFVDKDG